MLSTSKSSELAAKKRAAQQISWDILEIIIDELKIESITSKRLNVKNKEDIKKIYWVNPQFVLLALKVQFASYADFLKRFPQLSGDCKGKLESALTTLLAKLTQLKETKTFLMEEQALEAITYIVTCYTLNFENNFGNFTAFFEIRNLLLESCEVVGFSKSQLERKLISEEFNVVFNKINEYREKDQTIYADKLAQLSKKIEAKRQVLSALDYVEYRGVYLAYKCQLLHKNKDYDALQSMLGKIFRWHHEAYLLNRTCMAIIYDNYMQASVDLNQVINKPADALYIIKYLKRMLLKDNEVFPRFDKAAHFLSTAYPSSDDLKKALFVVNYNIHAYEYRLWELSWQAIDETVKKEIYGHADGHENFFITAKQMNVLLPLLEKYQIGYQSTENAEKIRILQIFPNTEQLIKLITNAYMEEMAKLITSEKPAEASDTVKNSTTLLLQKQYEKVYLKANPDIKVDSKKPATAFKKKPSQKNRDKREEKKQAALSKTKIEKSDYDVQFAQGFTFLEKGRGNVFSINSSRSDNTFIGIHPTLRKFLALKDRGSNLDGCDLKELEDTLSRGKEAGGKGRKGIALSQNKFFSHQEEAERYAKVKTIANKRYLGVQDQVVYQPTLGWCTLFLVNALKPKHSSEKMLDIAKLERELKKLGVT